LARWHYFHVEYEASSEMSRVPLRAADMAGQEAKLLRPNAQCPLLELAEWASPPIRQRLHISSSTPDFPLCCRRAHSARIKPPDYEDFLKLPLGGFSRRSSRDNQKRNKAPMGKGKKRGCLM
jgi:hypothetical protein